MGNTLTLSTVGLLLLTPLLSGCLTRSTTVGDRYSGTAIVASSTDNPRGAPKLDIPDSMTSHVSLSDYRSGAATGSGASPAAPSPTASPAPTPDAGGQGSTQEGTRATFSDLTAGQLNQLGEIIANSFGDSAMTMNLTATRSGDVVRMRGTADLSSLIAGRDYVKLTLGFAGPITATNGQQDSDTSVTWIPDAGKAADFTADAAYADPATAAFPGWTWLMAILCALAVLATLILAYLTRDQSPRPGRPRANTPTPPRRAPWASQPAPAKPTAPDTVTSD
ncbi:MAG: DUF3153 domain-containing protein [Gordonia sp. (in: high G+C Gram-positive bacteria)]